jgi:RNA polymerase sigma-70 factor (family 1)
VIDTFAPLKPLTQQKFSADALKSCTSEDFETLFKAEYPALCRYALGLLKDSDDARDTVQKVFIEIWEKRSVIIVQVSMRSYLYRSVHNRCLNLLKARKRFDHDADMQTMAVFAPGAEERIHHSELESRIRAAIGKLPPQCARIFEMSRFEHLKYQEIATALELSVKTVENQMGKALKILRIELSEYLTMVLLYFIF